LPSANSRSKMLFTSDNLLSFGLPLEAKGYPTSLPGQYTEISNPSITNNFSLFAQSIAF